MMGRGVFPGTGKSYICQKMVDKVIRLCLFVLLIDYFKNLKETL